MHLSASGPGVITAGHIEAPSDIEIMNLIKNNFDLSPRGIREMLNLSYVNYLPTASYGHFGRESEDNKSFTWEKIDKAKIILEDVN